MGKGGPIFCPTLLKNEDFTCRFFQNVLSFICSLERWRQKLRNTVIKKGDLVKIINESDRYYGLTGFVLSIDKTFLEIQTSITSIRVSVDDVEVVEPFDGDK